MRKVRLRHHFSWQGLQFFLYTHLGSSLSCKLPIYNIACYLHMCVGQRGGGHGRITEYAGHIIHQSTWHTVFGGERWKIWQKWQYSSVLQYTRRGSAASMKAQWARAAPALHTHRFCATHALLTRAVWNGRYTVMVISSKKINILTLLWYIFQSIVTGASKTITNRSSSFDKTLCI